MSECLDTVMDIKSPKSSSTIEDTVPISGSKHSTIANPIDMDLFNVTCIISRF